MSMFSHFDIAQGPKWAFSLGSGPGPKKELSSKPNTKGASSTAEPETTRKDPNPSPAARTNQNPTRLRLRFAPELDGIHCFESILPCQMDSFKSVISIRLNSIQFIFISGQLLCSRESHVLDLSNSVKKFWKLNFDALFFFLLLIT